MVHPRPGQSQKAVLSAEGSKGVPLFHSLPLGNTTAHAPQKLQARGKQQPPTTPDVLHEGAAAPGGQCAWKRTCIPRWACPVLLGLPGQERPHAQRPSAMQVVTGGTTSSTQQRSTHQAWRRSVSALACACLAASLEPTRTLDAMDKGGREATLRGDRSSNRVPMSAPISAKKQFNTAYEMP